MRTPDADNPASAETLPANHFGFDQPSRRTPFDPQTGIPPDTLPLAPNDRDGFICPQAAHIRKVNPRDIATDQGNSVDNLQRRSCGAAFRSVVCSQSAPIRKPIWSRATVVSCL